MEKNFGEQPEKGETPQDAPEHEKSLGEINLGGLVSSLDSYNEQFQPGSMMAESILGSIGEGKSKKNIEQRREDELSHILRTHKEELSRTGLGLEPVKTGIVMIESGAKKITKHLEMRINLVDGKRFIGYLDDLAANPIQESQTDALKSIAKSLTAQLTSQYQLENPNDERMIQLLGNLDQIIQKYQKIEANAPGLAESVTELAKYSEIARKKYLKEFLWAENASLLNEVGDADHYFGPSKWHMDASAESYRDMYWGRAVKVVKAMSKNPNARQFQLDLIDRLETDLRYAKEDLKTHSPEYLEEKTVESFFETIDDVYDQLQEIKGEK